MPSGVDAPNVQPNAECPGFALEIVNTKPLLETLQGIWNGKSDQHAIVEVDVDGVSFKIHDLGRNFQGLARLRSSMFNHFVVDGVETDMHRSVKFKVNLSVLVKCLSIYGSSGVSGMTTQIEYSLDDAEFRMVLLSGSSSDAGGSPIITECRIKTLSDCEDLLDDDSVDLFSALNDFEIHGCAIIKSAVLSDALCEIYSVPGAATISLSMHPNAPFLQIATHGSTGRCCVNFPQTSASVTKYEVAQPKQQTYQLSLIQGALKVLPSADLTQVQISENGMLCFQHHLQHRGGESSIMEFVILPEEDLNVDQSDDDDSASGGVDGSQFDTRHANVMRAQKNRSRNIRSQESKHVTRASDLFDEHSDNSTRNKGTNVAGEQNHDDPYRFSDSDEESYDEDRRHSLLSHPDQSDSDNSVVPPSQSEGESLLDSDNDSEQELA